jgi:hypothetical protein
MPTDNWTNQSRFPDSVPGSMDNHGSYIMWCGANPIITRNLAQNGVAYEKKASKVKRFI